jgi:Xaa-Pro aminopeptidase
VPQLQCAVDWPALVAANVAKVRRALDDHGVDLLFANNVDNVRYLTGYSMVPGPGLSHINWLMLSPAREEPTLFALDFYVDSIRQKLPWLRDVRSVPASVPDVVAALAAEHGAGHGRIAFDGYVPFTTGKAVERLLPDAEIVDGEAILVDARYAKAPAELAIVERCAAVAELGMRAAIDVCVEGALEYEVAAIAEYAMRSAGAEGFPYSAVVSSGENAAIMQEISSDKHLRTGELVMLDLGCMFEGYYCEFARTTLVGDAARPEQKLAYGTVRDALAAMIEEVRPGVPCSQLDAAGRRVIRDAGFGEWEPKYFIGHGIGMTHWEPPIIDSTTALELRPGMVLCLEPGIHKPGMGGMRLEDVVVVTDDGARVLTRTAFCDALL